MVATFRLYMPAIDLAVQVSVAVLKARLTPTANSSSMAVKSRQIPVLHPVRASVAAIEAIKAVPSSSTAV